MGYVWPKPPVKPNGRNWTREEYLAIREFYTRGIEQNQRMARVGWLYTIAGIALFAVGIARIVVILNQ